MVSQREVTVSGSGSSKLAKLPPLTFLCFARESVMPSGNVPTADHPPAQSCGVSNRPPSKETCPRGLLNRIPESGLSHESQRDPHAHDGFHWDKRLTPPGVNTPRTSPGCRCPLTLHSRFESVYNYFRFPTKSTSKIHKTTLRACCEFLLGFLDVWLFIV